MTGPGKTVLRDRLAGATGSGRCLARVLVSSFWILLCAAPARAEVGLQLAAATGGWLGVQVTDLHPEYAAARGFAGERGILVFAALPGSPARRAGLRAGDIILAVDGRPLFWFASMVALVKARPPGAVVEVLYQRDGERHRARVELGDLEAARSRFPTSEAMEADYQRCYDAYKAERYGEARRICRDLADWGFAKARFRLAYMESNGLGGPKESTRAAGLYRLAAEAGHATAQNNLGVYYRDGRGVARDEAHAFYWLERAVANGREKSVEVRDKLAARISSAARARARRWLAYEPREPTREELDRLVARAEAASRGPTPGGAEAGGGGVREVQSLLAGLGYRPGPVDGIMGGKTRAAIEAFQRDQGLAVDGRIGASLITALSRAAAGPTPQVRVGPAVDVPAATEPDLELEDLEGIDRF
jgi:hypothetical protein